MEENIKEESMEGGQGPKSEANKELWDGKKSPKAELWKYSAVGCKKKKKTTFRGLFIKPIKTSSPLAQLYIRTTIFRSLFVSLYHIKSN